MEKLEKLRILKRVLKKVKKNATIEKIACGGQYAEDRTSFRNEFGECYARRAQPHEQLGQERQLLR